MKSIVGIDTEGSYKPAVSLLGRLQFANLEACLVNVVEPVPVLIPYAGMVPAMDYTRFCDSMREAGERAVADAKTFAAAHGIAAETSVYEGIGAGLLNEKAKEMHAKLICVGSTHKGFAGALFGGGVAKGLATSSNISLLVAKKEPPPDRPLTVAFATDHSPYSNECLSRFLAQKPNGIGTIHLLTAYEMQGSTRLVVSRDTEMNEDDIECVVAESLKRKNQELAERVSREGLNVEPHLLKGHPNKALGEAMDGLNADLLVVGAMGHGFWDGLLLGSVALHQVVSEPYSVLVWRT